MPSPPLPPRIALTDDLSAGRGSGFRRKKAAGAEPSTSGATTNVFANGLVFFCSILMACVLAAFWKWQQAEEMGQAANRKAEIATKFSDGVLQDLALAREQSAKIDRERANLVRMLGEAERMQAGLRGELTSWQQKHKEVLGSSQQALAEWNKYSQTLEKNLGETREMLTQSNGTLQQERTVAQDQITQVETDRERAEREAATLAQQKMKVERDNNALDLKAQSLDAENARLDGDVSRMRGVISTLETSNTFLDSRNAALSVEISQLRSNVHRLEARIHSLEQGKDSDNSGTKHGN